nr:MAG TPA: hypothetical protein [Bacteriophage sp.]
MCAIYSLLSYLVSLFIFYDLRIKILEFIM